MPRVRLGSWSVIPACPNRFYGMGNVLPVAKVEKHIPTTAKFNPPVFALALETRGEGGTTFAAHVLWVIIL